MAKPKRSPFLPPKPRKPKSASSTSTPTTTRSKRIPIPPSPLAESFRHLEPDWRYYIRYLELAASTTPPHEDAERYLTQYANLTQPERDFHTPESLCDSLDPPLAHEDLFALVSAQLWRCSNQETQILSAVNKPKMVQQLLRSAKTKYGFKDRELFLKSTGFVPLPKSSSGPTVNVQVNTRLESNGEEKPSLGSPEDDVIELENLIPGTKLLE